MEYGGYIGVAFVAIIALWVIWDYFQRSISERKDKRYERWLSQKRPSDREGHEHDFSSHFFYRGEEIVIQPKPTIKRVVVFVGTTKKGNAIITWPKEKGKMSRRIIPLRELLFLRVYH